MARSDVIAKSKFIKITTKLHRTVGRAFNQEPDYPSSPFNERERYTAALFAIAQYFSSIAGKPVGHRFFELGSAIADLNVGTVHPLLQPVKAHNRRADHSQLWRARARVALALEALLRAGLTRNRATAKLTSDFPSIAKLASTKAKNSKLQAIALGWRKQLKQARVKNFEALELFSEGVRKISGLANRKQRLHQFAELQLSEAARSLEVLSPHS